MGRRLRMHLSEHVYFVTNRTIEERFWLTPCDKVRDVFGRWLARAVRKFRIELFAYCVMGNHFHLLLRARHGNLAAFMEYLQANVAKAINRLHRTAALPPTTIGYRVDPCSHTLRRAPPTPG